MKMLRRPKRLRWHCGTRPSGSVSDNDTIRTSNEDAPGHRPVRRHSLRAGNAAGQLSSGQSNLIRVDDARRQGVASLISPNRLRPPSSLRNRQRREFIYQIPPMYWESLGHDENYVRKMTDFQADLKEHICQLERKGSHHIFLDARDYGSEWLDRMLLHDNSHQSANNMEEILLHDDLLCPQWERFAKALHNHHGKQPASFLIANIQLKEVVLDTLMPAMKSKNLKKLTLHNNNLGRDGISFVAEFLEGDSGLKWLNLNHNQLDDTDAVARLSEAIRTHPTLHYLHLEECDIGNDTPIFSAIMCPKLKLVDLKGNRIGVKGAKLIAQYLATNPSIQDVNLENNQLNDQAAEMFARALKCNTKLKYLCLCNNYLSQIGEHSLLKAVYDASSLNAIADSNHTCQLILHGTAKPIHNEVADINRFQTPRKSMQKKIFLALRATTKCSLNLYYFNDVPVEIIPDVLAMLQHNPEGKQRYLNDIYEVMRNWNMPLLYTNNQTAPTRSPKEGKHRRAFFGKRRSRAEIFERLHCGAGHCFCSVLKFLRIESK